MPDDCPVAARTPEQRVLHLLDDPEAPSLAQVQSVGQGEGGRPPRGGDLEGVEPGHVGHAENVHPADEHGVVIAAGNEAAGEADGACGGGAGGGDDPDLCLCAEGVGQRLTEAVELGIEVHRLVERA